MDLNLKGKKALVTGASSGLGFEAALALSKEGADTFICSRSLEKLETAQSKINEQTGKEVQVIAADVATDEGRNEIFNKVNEVDILVSNAGGPPPGQFHTHEETKWDDAYNLVLKSAERLSYHYIQNMIEKRWGRLVYITSVGVLQPVNDLILSNSFRAAVTGMCKTISNNYAKYGITANCVCPGYTATDRLKNLAKSRASELGITEEEVINQFSSIIPAGRVGKPDELANLIVFLASDKAAYITGTSIPVDGGANKSLI